MMHAESYRDATPLRGTNGLCSLGLAGVDVELAIVSIVTPPLFVRTGIAGGLRRRWGGAGGARRVLWPGEFGADDAVCSDDALGRDDALVSEDTDVGESGRRRSIGAVSGG